MALNPDVQQRAQTEIDDEELETLNYELNIYNGTSLEGFSLA